MLTPSSPKLAPPGAGLPSHELFVARILFRLRFLTGNSQSFTQRFNAEQACIARLVEECPETRRGERVLIPRLPGLEDSSRFWSVWMTLDHLRITNTAMAGIITALQHGRVPPGQASTAAVKPREDADGTVIPDYECSCAQLLQATSTLGSPRQSSLRYTHPWFGPLTAQEWHSMAAGHMGIHRNQLADIVRRLSR
jgi:hypothetical protein